MVPNPLHDIPYPFWIKKMQRKLHPLCQEIRNQRYINPDIQVKQKPASDKVDRETRNKNNQLGHQNKYDKAQVIVPDTDIHQKLG